MTAIEKFQPEVVAPDQRTKAEQVDAYISRLVDQRVAELMARKEIGLFQPFFESKKVSDELRRLQTAPDWHKFRVFYERFGCMARCGERTLPHGALGMCQKCYRTNARRLDVITNELNANNERAEDIIDSEMAAYAAYRKAVPSIVPERKALPASSVATEPPIAKRVGRPHLKPQMSPEEAGPRMRKLRELAGLSQRRLAKAAGITQKTIVDFECGRRQMLPGNCAAVKRVLVEKLVEAFWPTPEGYQ